MKIYEKFKFRFIAIIAILIVGDMVAVFMIQRNTFDNLIRATFTESIKYTISSIERGLDEKREKIKDVSRTIVNSQEVIELLEGKRKITVNPTIDRYLYSFPKIMIEIYDKSENRIAKGLNVTADADAKYLKRAANTPLQYTDISIKNGKILMKNYSTIQNLREKLGTAVVSIEISEEELSELIEKHYTLKLYEAGKNNEKREGYFTARKEILDGIAEVEIGVKASKINEIKRDIVFKIWYVNIAFIIISMVIMNIIASEIITPMNRIITGLTELKKGNLNYRIENKYAGEIGTAVKSFNETTEYLRETRENEKRIYNLDKIASAGRLASGVAHEIKNPLASMAMIIDLYKRKGTDISFKHDDLALLSDEIKRINGILENLLDFSKSDKINIENNNIKDIVEDIYNLVEKKISSSGNHISIEEFGDGFDIKCDKNLIKQMILNLILNSSDAVSNGDITVKIDSGVKMLAIEVKDNGEGIDESIKEKVFEPFFTTKVNGNGIGLAVVKKIADIHSFEISIDSKKGFGTTVKIEIDKEKNKKLKVENINISDEIFLRRRK